MSLSLGAQCRLLEAQKGRGVAGGVWVTLSRGGGLGLLCLLRMFCASVFTFSILFPVTRLG